MLCDGSFEEVSGLGDDTEGDHPRTTVRAGSALSFVLRRGWLRAAGSRGELWQWVMDVLERARPPRRVDGAIRVLGSDGTLRATWTFERGTPAKLLGPELDAKSGDVAIEELCIAHDGLRLLAPAAAEPSCR